MFFLARSCSSATAAASQAPAGLARTPSLSALPLAHAPARAAAEADGALLHPSHPLYPRHQGRDSSAAVACHALPARSRSGVLARASVDGAAAAAGAAATTTTAAPPAAAPQQRQGGADERQQLLEYVVGGPLLASCGLSADSVRRDADEWCALGARLALQLGFVSPPAGAAAAAAAAATASLSPSPAAAAAPVAFASLDAVQRLRIYRYYLPVFFWARAQLERHAQEHGASSSSSSAASDDKNNSSSSSSGGAAAAPPPPPPLVLGISAPQGCGKTTLTEQLTELFTHLGYRVAGVSIDDFYLTRAGQQALADANRGNRLLELRGNAGSHDLALGRECLAALRACRSPEHEVAVPRYDKSAFQGKGDRAPEAEWPRVRGPLQLVLFEGWMLGFRPAGGGQDGAPPPAAAALTAAEKKDLAPVDAALRAYESAWDSFVDSWLVVRVGDPRWVFAWRLQAEQAMRAKGKSGMTDEGVADFVSRYLPAYTAYLPDLYGKGPTTARPGRTLVVEVDERRSPVEKQPPLPSNLVA